MLEINCASVHDNIFFVYRNWTKNKEIFSSWREWEVWGKTFLFRLCMIIWFKFVSSFLYSLLVTETKKFLWGCPLYQKVYISSGKNLSMHLKIANLEYSSIQKQGNWRKHTLASLSSEVRHFCLNYAYSSIINLNSCFCFSALQIDCCTKQVLFLQHFLHQDRVVTLAVMTTFQCYQNIAIINRGLEYKDLEEKTC